MNTKQHWEKVYETKSSNEVSWTQEKPETSLRFIRNSKLPKSAKIIDVGGGDSKLVDFLLEEGYENITVLDISAKAIEKAKERLGENAEKVKWIISDIVDFKPVEIYDLWHDRAAFHFLTDAKRIEKYKLLTSKFISNYLIIGTFSKNGPKKCSGLDIVQYDAQKITDTFQDHFKAIECFATDHTTPFGTVQNFQFCSFIKFK